MKRFDINVPITNDDDYADACILIDQYRRLTNADRYPPKFSVDRTPEVVSISEAVRRVRLGI